MLYLFLEHDNKLVLTMAELPIPQIMHIPEGYRELFSETSPEFSQTNLFNKSMNDI